MSGANLSDFADKVTELMMVISKEFFNHKTGEFYKTKVTIPQYVVMEILYKSGEPRMTDLANSIKVTTAAMTGIVERLVRDGYVERSNDLKDRRSIRVRLTLKGDRVVKAILKERKEITSKIFSVISQKEREEYLRILMHIRDHIVDGNH